MTATTVLREDVVLAAQGIGYRFPGGFSQGLQGIDLELRRGEVLALVGGSGAGKTTLSDILLGQRRPTEGTVRVDGEDLYALTGAARRQAQRGIQMIFQDPYDALPPRMTVGRIVEEPLRIHHLAANRDERRARVERALEQVGLTPASGFVERRPGELSGGQRQRVALASALAAEPRILLADEPVAMLDVSLKAEILHLLVDLARDADLAVLLVTHDLATVGSVAQRVAVMQAGRIVEHGTSAQVLRQPVTDYTRQLLAAARDLTLVGAG